MIKLVVQTVMAIMLLITMVYLIVVTSPNREVIGYDCRIAEIAPDAPVSYKEACRGRGK